MPRLGKRNQHIPRSHRRPTGRHFLLLHGPIRKTHITWAQGSPLTSLNISRSLAADLRGLRRTAASPKEATSTSPISKRSMAQDQVTLMRGLGHQHFGVAGHDRGGPRRAPAWRSNHPDAVSRIAVIDHRGRPQTICTRADQQGICHPLFLVVLPHSTRAAGPERMNRRRSRRCSCAKHIDWPRVKNSRSEPETCGVFARISALLQRSGDTSTPSARTIRAAATIDLDH